VGSFSMTRRPRVSKAFSWLNVVSAVVCWFLSWCFFVTTLGTREAFLWIAATYAYSHAIERALEEKE
jgi:hypothetical protein